VIGLSLFPNPPASITPFTSRYTPFNQLKRMREEILQSDLLSHCQDRAGKTSF
jgi:hypothetical protein